MCHTQVIEYFGPMQQYREFSKAVDGLLYSGTETKTGTESETELEAEADSDGDAGIRVAVLPDIYGLTEFYKGYASNLSGFGARTYLTNPWSAFGELAEPTREAAYERRRLLRDREHCDQLQEFLAAEKIDAVVGFCIGGNFAFELARRGYAGTIIAIYPLPWGMANQDEITPAFEYMPSLATDVTILMGAADHLAGPDNIRKMQDIVAGNERLTMYLYDGSNHGFFTDIDGADEKLKSNAKDAIDRVNGILF